MKFVDTIPGTNCADWVCDLCGTQYVSAGRPKCEVCAAALLALREWRQADRELFAAKAAYMEASGSKASLLWTEVVRLKKVEEEKRALLMLAADRLG